MNKIIEQHYCNEHAEVFSQYLANANTEHEQLAQMYIKLAKKAGNPSRFSKIMKALFLKLNIASKAQIAKSSYKQLLGGFFDLLTQQIGKDLALFVHDSIEIIFDVPSKKDSETTKEVTK